MAMPRARAAARIVVPGATDTGRLSMVRVMAVIAALDPKAEIRRRAAGSFSPYCTEEEVQFFGFAPEHSRLNSKILFCGCHHAEEEHALF